MIEKTKKAYQVWCYHGVEGYSLEEYDTLEECINHDSYGSEKIITRKVDFEITEKSDDKSN